MDSLVEAMEKKLDYLCVFEAYDWSVVSFLEKNKDKLHILARITMKLYGSEVKINIFDILNCYHHLCGETYQVEFKYFKDSKEQEEHEWRGEGKRSLFVEKQI